MNYVSIRPIYKAYKLLTCGSLSAFVAFDANRGLTSRCRERR
jgi:hypothetical protein